MESIAPCRSVDRYTRLNKIAEGTYGNLSIADQRHCLSGSRQRNKGDCRPQENQVRC